MTATEIKTAVLDGLTVHWANEAYTVQHLNNDFYIVFAGGKNMIGLTWQDGTTLNGIELDFYISK